MLKILVLLSLFAFWACPLASQESADSIYTFYFVPRKDNFYLSYKNNRKELKRLMALVEWYRTSLTNNSVLIYVDGYCNSLPAVKDNLAVAKIRSNRVKSELITHEGMKEADFVTCNHTNKVNPAIGRHIITEDKVAIRLCTLAAELPVSAGLTLTSGFPILLGTPAFPFIPSAPAISRLPEFADSRIRKSDRDSVPRFALKTNLLYAAALMINAEAEYYLRKRLSLNIDWQYAWWSKRSKHKYYRLAAVSPELRYWFASKENFRGHFGGFYLGTGLYEFMFKPTRGIQGEFFIAGGLTYGYMFPIGRRMRMELSLGVGYMMTEYRRYHWDRGCYVYEKTQRYSYFGPTKAKVSLVFPLKWLNRNSR